MRQHARAKDTSLDYELGPDREPERDQVAAFAERRGLDLLRPKSEIVVRRAAPERPAPELAASKRDRLKQRVRAAAQRQERPAPDLVPGEAVPAPLLPAHRDAWGQDSQGRGTTAAEIAAAAGRDVGVQRCRGELGVWVQRAYRDPDEAWRRLQALEASEGGPRGAEWALHRHDGGAALLGELRGKAGWFASKASKAERDAAERCAGSVGSGLVRLRDAEERAGQGYKRDVEDQRARDTVAVPGLSLAAWAAVRAVEQAGEAAERAAKARLRIPVIVIG